VIVGRLAYGTRDTVFEQPTTESEAVTAGAIGEKTVMADAMEAVRQSVQQKAADELVGIECHHFGPAVRTVVFPGKADVSVGEREQPAVSDGDAMGVAAEIGQHLFGASKRCLGVDYPVEALEFAQATCGGLRFGKIGEIGEEPQFAGPEGVLQLLQEQPSEQPREDAHRQEEAGAASDPAPV
jgi:hypothetical protein